MSPHFGGITGYLHTDHAASIAAAVGLVGGSAATAGAWHSSTHPTSPPATTNVTVLEKKATTEHRQGSRPRVLNQPHSGQSRPSRPEPRREIKDRCSSPRPLTTMPKRTLITTTRPSTIPTTTRITTGE